MPGWLSGLPGTGGVSGGERHFHGLYRIALFCILPGRNYFIYRRCKRKIFFDKQKIKIMKKLISLFKIKNNMKQAEQE